jgi:hypothetical protein
MNVNPVGCGGEYFLHYFLLISKKMLPQAAASLHCPLFPFALPKPV